MTNKVHVTVTITVRRGEEKYHVQIQLTDEPPTRDAPEIADNIVYTPVEAD